MNTRTYKSDYKSAILKTFLGTRFGRAPAVQLYRGQWAQKNIILHAVNSMSFAFWRVLHSGEFCIRASFAFGQVLYSGVFCIWAGFAFGRVLHSSIPYSLANRNTRDVQRLYVLKYGEYGKSAKSALMHQLSHLNRL